ncbi:response regulator [Microvirga sp. BT689]|uniref:response regulator n=1 Tax=Microvirga arvi TaxID=2778731 RepID=UPI00194F68A0|nr:response regulator [Microvirga arvi]MBM6581988.1 response regulator [Microvirga arvi]
MSTSSTHLSAKAGPSPQTVLVVEDEVLIRLVIAEYLRECGYRVHEAVNADEAILILRAPEVSVDIVFSDVEMPGDMDGFGLARWVRANMPQTQVILTSGAERSADIAGTLCEAGPLLEKPYPTQDVVDRIRQLAAKANRS